MTVVDVLMQKVWLLPIDKQQQVLAFVENMERHDTAAADAAPRRTLFSTEGLWRRSGADLSPEEIAEARREMWGKYDRPDNEVRQRAQ